MLRVASLSFLSSDSAFVFLEDWYEHTSERAGKDNTCGMTDECCRHTHTQTHTHVHLQLRSLIHKHEVVDLDG